MLFMRKLLMSAVAAVSLAAPALAADMPFGAPSQMPSLIPQEVGTGWYLRGDVGYALGNAPDVSHNGTAFSGYSMPDKGIWGLGFGYQLNDMVRFDVTLDKAGNYRLNGNGVCSVWTDTLSTCSSTSNAASATREVTSIGAIALLANAYVDIANWNGLTPYVGAGFGVARVTVDGHDSTRAGDANPTHSFGAATSYSLAAAASAGASYTLGEGIMLDLNYRYLWIDGGHSGAERLGTGETGDIKVRNLTSHQIRAGMRYYLN